MAEPTNTRCRTSAAQLLPSQRHALVEGICQIIKSNLEQYTPADRMRLLLDLVEAIQSTVEAMDAEAAT